MGVMKRHSQLLALVLCFLCLEIVCLCNGDGTICRELERKALVDFKQGLEDPDGLLSSWTGLDCCSWTGVRCHNHTGHVVKLDLYNSGSFIRLGLRGEIRPSLLVLKHLRYLDLSRNYFEGNGIPAFMGSLVSLQYLKLSSAGFSGRVPHQLGNLSRLRYLDLSGNSLNGTIPKYLGQLFPKLASLDLSYNNLAGILTEAHFDNLMELQFLYINSNAFELIVRPEWVPPLELIYLDMSDCKLGPKFPSWLPNLKNTLVIKMSNASIADALPVWFWNFSSNVRVVDLSYNEIRDRLPAGSTKLTNLVILDLSHNYLEGQLPQFSRSTFSNTSIIVPSLSQLYISSNKITGSIPETLCELKYLQILDLSQNMIKGVVPDCWNHSFYPLLQVMDLSHNNLSGIIPASIGSESLLILHLNNNEFSGELPFSFKNCTSLMVLDLGYNKISGSIPTWLAENSKALETLQLRNNMLTGSIPPQLGNLRYLRVIDVSNNHLSGAIPHSFGNFTAMKSGWEGFSGIDYYENNIEIIMKGTEVQLERLSALLICIDLSNNMLSGEIPEELAHLSFLQSLNLSRNQLSGQLSEKIGELRRLEVLDLSVNNLSGVLPPTMTNLTSLNHLNLSYNNFYGKIPYGGQLQALPDPSIYSGNQGLCGFPLDKKCETEATTQPPSLPNDEDDDNLETIWFYLSVSLGFIFGFWAIFGALILKKSWRYAYFRFVDHIYDKIYVIVAVNLKKMKRKCGLASE